MKRKPLAALAAIALAFSLSACGPRQEEMCVDRNGTQHVCEDDDDNDGGWFPVFIPWSQPHQSNNHKTPYKAPVAPKPAAPKAPAYKAPAYKAPAYKAPAYKAPAYKAPARSK